MGPDPVIPPPPDGSGIVSIGASSGIPPAPDGTAAVPMGAQPPEKQGPVRRFLGNLAEQVNPVTAVKGIAQLTAHPIGTYNADASARSGIFENAKQRFSQGDIPGGIAKGVEAFVPFLGPALSRAGDQFEQGDIAGGAGASVGMGLNMAGPAALKGAGINVPAGMRRGIASASERLYQSALKPSTRIAPAATEAMVQTGLREGIPVSKAGLEKLSGLVDDLNSQIAAEIQAAGPNRTISPQRAIQNTVDLENQFKTQVNPTADLEAIKASREDFVNQLRPKPGEAMYHGSSVDPRTVPDSTLSPGREGFFATESPEHAKWYANSATRNETPGTGRLYLAESPQNPLDLRTPEQFRSLVEKFEQEAARLDSEAAPYSGLFAKRTATFREALNAGADPKTLISKMLDAAGAHAKAMGKGSEIDASFVRDSVRGMGHDAYLTTEAIPESGSPARYKTTTYLDRPNLTPLEEGQPLPPRNLSASEAQAMKQGTYRQLKSRSYGELKSATIEAQKALARGLKEELAAQFPEIDLANAKESGLLRLQPVIEKAVQRATNRQMIGIGAPITGIAVKAATGSSALSGAAGIIKAIWQDPVLRSNAALWVNKMSQGRIPLPVAKARVLGYANAIGQGEQSATDQPAVSQGSQ